jgi:hypothetical protein
VNQPIGSAHAGLLTLKTDWKVKGQLADIAAMVSVTSNNPVDIDIIK